MGNHCRNVQKQQIKNEVSEQRKQDLIEEFKQYKITSYFRLDKPSRQYVLSPITSLVTNNMDDIPTYELKIYNSQISLESQEQNVQALPNNTFNLQRSFQQHHHDDNLNIDEFEESQKKQLQTSNSKFSKIINRSESLNDHNMNEISGLRSKGNIGPKFWKKSQWPRNQNHQSQPQKTQTIRIANENQNIATKKRSILKQRQEFQTQQIQEETVKKKVHFKVNQTLITKKSNLFELDN